MKQDEIDKMMCEIDKKCKLPKHWNEFIAKQTKNFNYIIKDTKQKECYCTNCKHSFFDTKVRIADFFNCPNCKNRFYVVSKNANYIKSFKKSVDLVQKINKNIIVRVFEIETFYNENTKMMENDIEEYCRIIPGKGKFLSDAVWFYCGYIQIYHCYSNKVSWRQYKGHRYFSDFPVYPFNQNKMVKNTKFQYAPIKEFTQRFWRYNFIDVIEFAAYESFELLWNMKLYNLCFDAKRLNKNGSFYKRFGVSKDYLEFMQEHNIDYRELKLLQLFKEKDINLISACYRFNYNHIKFLYESGILKNYFKYRDILTPSDIKDLKRISEFIPLKKLNNYLKGLKNLQIYKDYLEMSKKLALNYKSNKDLFPRNLISRHDKMQTKLNIMEDMNTQSKAYIRYLGLSKYTYSDDKYIIFPAPSIDSMKDEGNQQGNCVGYLYLDRYINGETEIFFARKLNDVTKSFITLEYKNGYVVQKELPHHDKNFTDEQLSFIDKWLRYRNFIDQKERVKNKYKCEVIKYNIKKMAA